MRTLQEVAERPSGFDSRSNYMGAPLESLSDLYVVLTRNRDSNFLNECNWSDALDRLGGESENVEIHRFGHWACGWWEALCVNRHGHSKIAIAEKILTDLENYPILNEDEFSAREYEAANDRWYHLPLSERVDLCREAGVSIFSARANCIPLHDDDNGYIYDHCRPE